MPARIIERLVTFLDSSLDTLGLLFTIPRLSRAATVPVLQTPFPYPFSAPLVIPFMNTRMHNMKRTPSGMAEIVYPANI